LGGIFILLGINDPIGGLILQDVRLCNNHLLAMHRVTRNLDGITGLEIGDVIRC